MVHQFIRHIKQNKTDKSNFIQLIHNNTTDSLEFKICLVNATGLQLQWPV